MVHIVKNKHIPPPRDEGGGAFQKIPFFLYPEADMDLSPNVLITSSFGQELSA